MNGWWKRSGVGFRDGLYSTHTPRTNTAFVGVRATVIRTGSSVGKRTHKRANTHGRTQAKARTINTQTETQASAVTHFEASLSFLFANEVKEAKIFNTIYS